MSYVAFKASCECQSVMGSNKVNFYFYTRVPVRVPPHPPILHLFVCLVVDNELEKCVFVREQIVRMHFEVQQKSVCEVRMNTVGGRVGPMPQND